MTPQQEAAIRAALPFCRDRLNLPRKGALDYEAAARQIAALPDAEHIRGLVGWVMAYEAEEQRSSAPPKTKT